MTTSFLHSRLVFPLFRIARLMSWLVFISRSFGRERVADFLWKRRSGGVCFGWEVDRDLEASDVR